MRLLRPQCGWVQIAKTAIWERLTRMTLRRGDVVLSTPPKSGTIWTLAMIYLILNGADARFEDLSSVAPWIDHRRASAASHDAGRRVFKTHTPLDGIPIVDGVHYIAVFRGPAAAFLSMRRHLANMTIPLKNHPNAGLWPEAFHHFLSAAIRRDNFGGVTLSTLNHYLTCAERSATLILHYQDIVADHLGTIRKLADHLGVALTEKGVRDIAAITCQRNMALQSERFTPGAQAGFLRENARFFASARTARERLTPVEETRLGAAISDIFELSQGRVAELVEIRGRRNLRVN